MMASLSLRLKRLTLILAALAGLLVLSACGNRGEAWQRIQESGVMRVGLDPTYPPFANADGGDLVGIDVDLAREIGSEFNVDVHFVYFGYDGLYDALATGQVDLLVSALVVRPEQLRDFAYSEPYFNAGQLLVVARNAAIGGMEDLSNQTLAVELGAQGHVIATDWQRRVRDLAIQPYATPHEALDVLARGAADAALVDAISAHIYLAADPGLRMVQPSVSVEPFAMVVRIEDELLLKELNDALQKIEGDGRLDAIITKQMQAAAVALD